MNLYVSVIALGFRNLSRAKQFYGEASGGRSSNRRAIGFASVWLAARPPWLCARGMPLPTMPECLRRAAAPGDNALVQRSLGGSRRRGAG
jgi:hypothetical protein